MAATSNSIPATRRGVLRALAAIPAISSLGGVDTRPDLTVADRIDEIRFLVENAANAVNQDQARTLLDIIDDKLSALCASVCPESMN